jgi:uncharacterized membrane protein HdeD (DUF308 family)
MLYELLLEIYLFLSWDCGLFDISIPLIAILYVIVTIIVLKIVLYLFPFLNRFADGLTRPFRSARFVFRVNTAHKLENELKEEQSYNQTYGNQPDIEVDRIELGVYNRLEVNSRHDSSNVYYSSTRLGDDMKVAMSPWKLFFLILGGYTTLFPLLLLANPAHSYIVHSYFALVLCHVIIPRGADFEMVFNATVRKGLIRNFLMNWMLLGFFCIFLGVTLITGNVVLALIIALLSAGLYNTILLPFVHLSRWWKKHTRPKYPEVGDIPDSDVTEKKRPVQPSLSPSIHNDFD